MKIRNPAVRSQTHLVLRDDWNFGHSESSCPLMKPGCCTLRPFGGGLLVFYKLLIYPTSLAGPVSLGHPVLAQNPLWEVSRRRFLAIRFVMVFHSRGSLSPLLKPSLLNALASRRGGVGRCSY